VTGADGTGGEEYPHPGVVAAVAEAWKQMLDRAYRAAPFLATRLEGWVEAMFGGRGLEPAFTALLSYPLVHLPVWAAPDIAGTPFLDDVTRSSVAGYLHVRLVDNVVDDDRDRDDRRLLPVANFLHIEFELPYHRHFPPGHSFWEVFTESWVGAAEAAIIDSQLESVDLAGFERWAARKTMSAVIPVAAALLFGGDHARLHLWREFIDAFGRWHQLENDFLGWRKDHQHHNPSLVVSEARRRGVDSSHMEAWFLQEGFEWGAGLLERYRGQVRLTAAPLNCRPLHSFVDHRFSAHADRINDLRIGVAEIHRLAGIVSPTLQAMDPYDSGDREERF
jgi:hypothetical protein